MKNVKTFFNLHGRKLLAFLGALLALSALIVVPAFADSPLDPLRPIVRWYAVDRLSPPEDYLEMSAIYWNVSKSPGGLTIENNLTADASWIVSNPTILIDTGSSFYTLTLVGSVSIVYDYDIDTSTQSVRFSTRTTNVFTFLTFEYDITNDVSTIEILSTNNGVNELIPTGSMIQLFYDPLSLSGSNAGRLYSLFGTYQMTDFPSFVRGGEVGDDAAYNRGLAAGREQGYNQGIQVSQSEAYAQGRADAQAEIDSGEWGFNLLGDTLSAPFRAMNRFTLVTTPSGFNITLGLVVGCAIALTLFIAFLKLFAGG